MFGISRKQNKVAMATILEKGRRKIRDWGLKKEWSPSAAEPRPADEIDADDIIFK